MLGRVDYDTVAPAYDRRYEQNPLAGVARELHAPLSPRRNTSDSSPIRAYSHPNTAARMMTNPNPLKA